MSERRLVILGKQGSGKGTQATRLAQHYAIVHLSTGDLFREQIRQDTAFGREAKRFVDAGELVPDEIVIGVVEECLEPGGSLAGGFVLDGFPRTREQAMKLEELLSERPLDAVINLEVDTATAIARMLARGRDDDTEEAISRRLELYDRETRPILDYYRETGHLIDVDGIGSIDAVFDRIVGAIESHRAVGAS